MHRLDSSGADPDTSRRCHYKLSPVTPTLHVATCWRSLRAGVSTCAQLVGEAVGQQLLHVHYLPACLTMQWIKSGGTARQHMSIRTAVYTSITSIES